MRIVFMVSSMQGGGAERVAALLCSEWARQGHQVTLMATYSRGGDCGYPLHPQVRFLNLSDLTRTRLSRTLPGRLLTLRRWIRRERADVVLAFMTQVNVAAVLAAGSTPLVVSERIHPPLMPTGLVWRLLRRITYPCASRVVMQTGQGLAWLSAILPRARGAVLSNPLLYPVPNAEPLVPPEDWVPAGRKLMLGVGRLTAQKNFGLMIEAFASVAAMRPDWMLAILGEGEERAMLQTRIDALGLADRVRLIGRVGNLDAWCRRADAFVSTSLFEGFPNALLEALAYGLPALSLDCPTGPAELIRPGLNGRLVPVESDAETVAVAMEDLIARDWPGLDAAAEMLRDRHRVDRIAAEWIALFEAVRNEDAAASERSREGTED